MTTATIEQAHSPIAKALAAFQADLPKVELDADNPHFKSKFTSLSHLSSVVLPLLSKHGIAFSATPQVTENGFVMEAHLLHESGERLTASFPITDTLPQKVGSAVTYYRRYALAALTGVVADLDDDGHAASNSTPGELALEKARGAKAPVKPKTPVKPTAGGGSQDKIREWIGADDARKGQANEVVTRIKAEKKLTGVAVFDAAAAELGL